MNLKKQNKSTKFRKINTVDPKRNKAITMGNCNCYCTCIQVHEHQAHFQNQFQGVLTTFS